MGKARVESKHAGGGRFMAWCGAMLMLIVILLIVAFGDDIMIAHWLINKYAAKDERLPLHGARA